MKKQYVLVVIFHCVFTSFCANILIADPMPSPSHQIWNYGIAEGLLARDHNVTMISQLPPIQTGHKNFHHIDLEGLHASVMQDLSSHDISEMSNLEMLQFFQDYSLLACEHAVQREGFKTLMAYPKDFKFDIILFDLTIGNCFLPFIQKFGFPPAVGLTAFLIPSYLSYDFGNELYVSYIPNFHTSYTTDMNFIQRLDNYFWTFGHIIAREVYMKGRLDKILAKAFDQPMDLPNLENHVSLLLANWNPVLNHPQGITPNIIPVGGAHIRPKKLPKDIQEIMDKSSHGVILFSLGSNVRSDDFTEVQLKIIINTFNKIKETVLWKFETNITGLPKNVIVRKWLPQLEILAHPNLKLFISHCGGLSAIEASHFGVPVLGMPFFIDQHLNVDNLVRKQVARKVDYKQLTENIFYENIYEMLQNDKYKKNMKDLSLKMRDQPLTPLDTAVFWIEYAIRHNGTHFFNPKSRYLPLFITSSADIYLFFICVTCLFVYILKAIYKIGKKIIINTIENVTSKSKNE